MKYIRAKRDSDGFTLIELLVVVLIIGVLAAIAVPVFFGQVDNARQSAVQAAGANAEKLVRVAQVSDSSSATLQAALEKAATSDVGVTFVDPAGAPTTEPGQDFCIKSYWKEPGLTAAEAHKIQALRGACDEDAAGGETGGTPETPSDPVVTMNDGEFISAFYTYQNSSRSFSLNYGNYDFAATEFVSGLQEHRAYVEGGGTASLDGITSIEIFRGGDTFATSEKLPFTFSLGSSTLYFSANNPEDAPLSFSLDLNTTIALDASSYYEGRAAIGDLVKVETADGNVFNFKVLEGQTI